MSVLSCIKISFVLHFLMCIITECLSLTSEEVSRLKVQFFGCFFLEKAADCTKALENLERDAL